MVSLVGKTSRWKNTMSDDRIMTQASTNNTKKKTLQNNNNGTVQKQMKHTGVNETMKGGKPPTRPSASTSGPPDGKENRDEAPPSTTAATDGGITKESGGGLSVASSLNATRVPPLNGHTAGSRASIDGGGLDKKSPFIKQQSEASSSGATGEFNAMNESMMTNESSLANKSFATSISMGGQTDKSAGVISTNSTKSDVSSAEIRAEGVECICKFYAKRKGDKKSSLLRDVALAASGEVLITDSKNRNVKVFTIGGEYIRSISHPDLKDPYGIATLNDSKFVVADRKAKDLKIFTLEGELVEKVGRNLDDYPMKSPRGVAINSKGEIVVSDSVRKCVYIYPIEGAFCEIIWGEAGLKPLQFKNPCYVGVTKHDDIIVSDYFSKKIAVFDAHTHDLKFTYGTKANDKKLSYPRGVATDMEGNILIADNYNGKIHHVHGEEGGFIQFVYGDKHSIHRIRSVACDEAGHMAIIENGGRVKVFDISQMRAKVPSDKVEDEEPEHPPDGGAPQ